MGPNLLHLHHQQRSLLFLLFLPPFLLFLPPFLLSQSLLPFLLQSCI